MNQITNTKSKTNQKLGPTHQTLKRGILSLFIAHSHSQTNKRGLSADSLSLFLSALRPRLFLPLKMRKFGQNSHKIVALSSTLGILSIFSTFFIENIPVSATSLNLSLPSSGIKLEGVTPNGAVKESVPGTVSVTSDAPFGYTLSLKGKDTNGNSNNSNKLINGSNILNPISKALSLAEYQSTGEINTWAYKPSKLNGVSNDDYQAGPSSTDPVVIDNPKSILSGSQDYSITLAAKIDGSLAAGTYQNTFIFSLMANTAHFSITYHLNEGVGGPANPQTGDTTELSIAIGDPTPTREGYEFKGWCSINTTGEKCSGQTYTAGQEYTLHEGDNNLELWAMWKSSKPTTMQNFGNYCDSMRAENEDDIITLEDTRDGSTYRVAKLADGKCWMIDNLKIVGTTISDQDSDIESGIWTIPESSINGFDSHDTNNAYYEENNKDPDGDDYGAYYSWYTATVGIGTESFSSEARSSICPKGWRLPRAGYNSGDFGALDIAMGGTGFRRYDDTTVLNKFLHKPIPGFTYAGDVHSSSLGGQGGSGCYWSSNGYNSTETYRLCFGRTGFLDPAYEDFYTQAKYYGRSVRCIARNFKELSPDLLTQQFAPITENITIRAGDNIDLIMVADYTLRPYYAAPGTDVSLSVAYGKPYILSITPKPGYKLKTIEQSPDGTITAIGEVGTYPSMQDFTSDQCTAEGTNVTDTRNNISYTVAKIGDRCWMLNNLRLGAGTVLTDADSNISSSSFTLPITAWTSSDQDSVADPVMKECHGIIGNDSADSDCSQSGPVTEYYYNWPAAKAGTSSTISNGYSICPKNWTLPNYHDDITAANAWNYGANPGMLATVGYFYSASQSSVNGSAYWWSSRQQDGYDNYADTLWCVVGGHAGLGGSPYGYYSKSTGHPIRCMLTN